MAVAVSEIMNHEVFSVRAGDQATKVMQHLMALGITGAPVLEADGRPVGFVSLRDLVGAPESAHVLSRMSAPVESVVEHASIREVAERMSETARQHLVVVDAHGHAVGVVSTLDVIRGLIGRPAPHPEAFPHFDPRTGVSWSNDAQLSFAAVESAPAGPGLFVLIDAQPGHANRIVWSEGTDNLHVRLRDLLATPASAPPHLVDAAVSGRLWFRWASTAARGVLPKGTP
ncbi:MAG: CBS domain-containing protein [Nannocystaceae bacterium]|nr:CBS domain-containing protein [Nannocystaceae bacterium]